LFHPTFLYESIGCAVLGVVLLQLDRRGKARDGLLFAWYVVGYVTMRFFIEGLRIDPARNVAGLRFNQWTSIVVGVLAVAWIVRRIRRNDESADLANVRAPGDGSTPQP
jgi:prolipoprotein diacylglyceryltransferase